ncbi:MAG: NAD-dependent epimerase/dehydratase family protein [Myxococcales bacterium]|nr:NAD-dependent epimerase/dehydratase family protein [Myxococcales bacterium]
MILVTGATGRLGTQVVRVLRSIGLDVRCLVRKGSEYFWLNDTGAAYFFGDLRDAASLGRAMQGVQHVIAAHGVRVERTGNDHRAVNADGSAALFEAARSRGVEHLVYISCAAVESEGDTPALSSKRAAEAALASSGLSYTVLRPGLFVQNFADLARRVEANGNVFLPGSPATPVSPIHTRDLALMALASLELPALKNATLRVGGPERMTIGDALSRMCRVNALPESHWPLPPAGLRALAAVARPFGRRWSNHARALAEHYSYASAVDGGAMATTFGIPLTPYDEAARTAFVDRHPSEDPTARDEKVVHRQFTATIYEPGVISWEDLPSGPPPRRD